MLVQIRQKLLFNAIAKYGKQRKYSVSTISEVKSESKDTVDSVYPPIEDLGYKARKNRKRKVWHDKIQSLKTVEEKLFELNMPRYYGWRLMLLKEHSIPYNSLSQAQYITRTHVMKEPSLPAYYKDVIPTGYLDNVLQTIKSNIEENIVFEHCSRRRQHEISTEDLECKGKIEDIVSKALIERINRTILTHLSPAYPHLLDTEVDFEPRLEASWFTSMDPPKFLRDRKMNDDHIKEYADEPVDLPVQYLGQPVLHLRHKYPLREIISLNDCENSAFDVPTYKYSPKVLRHIIERRHAVNIPGFWPGNQNEFGLLSYHNCAYLQTRPKEFNDTPEALVVQAILASYSWLLSQACYQGFSTFNDITYPLITQTVITNGQWWSFFVYQLNTTLVHSEHADENPKRNICWITEPMQLYDKIENEKVHGLNEEVLKTLIQFYANTPEERTSVDMQPYLGKSVKVIADIKHDERRNWLEEKYKYLVSNRPRHKRLPEIYDWQRIYIIKHKTRPMDKKRELWERGINIYKRRLDDHLPSYIPRCLRENPKKRKIGRWAKTYYP